MTDFITIIFLLVVIGSAIGYIIKSKKKGIKCIGCPYHKSCQLKKDGKPCDSDCK